MSFIKTLGEKREKKMFFSIKVTCTQKFKRNKNMVIF